MGAVLLLLVVAALALAYAGWLRYERFRDAPIALQTTGNSVLIESGDSFAMVLGRLRAAGIERGHDLEWKALAMELDVMRRLHVGEYTLEPGMTARELLGRFGRGEVLRRPFTLVEGWTFRQMREALASMPHLEHTLADLDEAELMGRLGADGVPAEGRFLPETYLYTRGDTDESVLRRAYEAMNGLLEQEWPQRDPDLPLSSPDEALVLASIVEKETGLATERAQIAGVFVRRLQLGMKLQTDPTVIYGIGANFDGNLTRAHLVEDNPFNTYTRFGLPPSPIAMPGRDAILAVLHPADGDALYFVSRGDGSHEFSRTLAEHNAAVRRYQLRR
ncbi:MAG TPA: endolytic transglycosylase MltG [Xanthomonadaceae bacterium]|nr:endolytic transglycosylase MltG [Xanthomonadaceae bacterium]